MQYFTIFMLNMHQIQQEKHFLMGKGEILLGFRRQKIFACVILDFALLLPDLSTPLYIES